MVEKRPKNEGQDAESAAARLKKAQDTLARLDKEYSDLPMIGGNVSRKRQAPPPKDVCPHISGEPPTSPLQTIYDAVHPPESQ